MKRRCRLGVLVVRLDSALDVGLIVSFLHRESVIVVLSNLSLKLGLRVSLICSRCHGLGLDHGCRLSGRRPLSDLVF